MQCKPLAKLAVKKRAQMVAITLRNCSLPLSLRAPAHQPASQTTAKMDATKHQSDPLHLVEDGHLNKENREIMVLKF